MENRTTKNGGGVGNIIPLKYFYHNVFAIKTF